jgi:RND superfamily putative drug exporter
MHRPNFAARAAAWSVAHRRVAIGGWIALVVLAFALAGAVGQDTLDPSDAGNGDSQRAERAIDRAGFPDRVDEQVLVQVRGSGTTVDPAFAAGVRDVVVRLRRMQHVQDVRSPLDPHNAGQVARDGRSALVTFKLLGDAETARERVAEALAATAAAQRANPGLRIEQFGDASSNKALSEALSKDFHRAEYLSLPITLAILVVAFGSLVAAGIPLALGISSVCIALGLIAPLSRLVPVEESISSVILLIGLAVGVDYSMFYLRRRLEERDAGRSSADALAVAAATSGRAVVVSGLTVMIAMAGMLLAGNAVFTSFGIGTMIVVAVAVAGSVTVLPATLSKLGDRVERGRVPWIASRRHRSHESRAWGFVLDRTLRRPLLSLILGGGALLLLAAPALHLKTVNTGVQGLPRDLPIMQTYFRIQAAFPGGPLPAFVTVQAPDVTSASVNGAIERLRIDAVDTGLMSDPTAVIVNPRRDLAIVSIPLKGSGTDTTSNRALDVLRDQVIPDTVAAIPGVRAHTTGLTAGSRDFNDTMQARLPLVFGFVLSLAFVLLLVTFRSIVVPIKAIVLNLLSVGAAYGVLTWVFQDGHLEGLLGFDSIGGITAWLPLFLFVILFGLSMDYHVFILSRIREAVDRGEPTEAAVVHGIRTTAGIVTSAAVVMIAVFSIFGTLSALDFKMMGLGLAVAVLLDATVVRAVLLPAAMKLLGEANWYLPRWLQWLPEVRLEPPPAPPEVDFGALRAGAPGVGKPQPSAEAGSGR